MTMPALRVRRPSGVSAAGSALTPSRAGVPEECDEDREEEEEEEDPNLLGAHGPARRCCAGAAALAGYANGGSLPPSRYVSTPSSVRPGTPHHRWRPSLFCRPPTTGAPLVDAKRCCWRRSKYAAQAAWLSAAYWGR